VNLSCHRLRTVRPAAAVRAGPCRIDARWKDLQREAHPDKFAAQGAAAQRVALQWSVRINEAYQRLKDPLQARRLPVRAAGAPIDAENNTAMPADFLMEQMEWRETLDDARGRGRARSLRPRTGGQPQGPAGTHRALAGREGDAAAAAQQVRALMFLERFGEDIENRLAQLGQ
jgi:molecular chaperone HscB